MRFEHWWFTLPLRLRSIFLRQRVESELEEELRFHLEHTIDEGIAAGLSPREARRRALLARAVRSYAGRRSATCEKSIG